MIWWIAILGGLGAASRYSVSKLVSNSYAYAGFPVGTLFVNVLGSLLMGFLVSLFLYRLAVDDVVKNAILVGFLGGFTTFSSFSIEVVKMLQNQNWLQAVIYMLASVLLCVLMCILGLWLGRQLA